MLIGIDVIENERFGLAMKRHPDIIDRVFTTAEQDYCLSKKNPVQHFAARFAAKEAVGKAMGTGVQSWRDIEIVSGGRPQVRLFGKAFAAAQAAKAGAFAVSMSHCGPVSVSVAVANIRE